jgi:hypothetical protein
MTAVQGKLSGTPIKGGPAAGMRRRGGGSHPACNLDILESKNGMEALRAYVDQITAHHESAILALEEAANILFKGVRSHTGMIVTRKGVSGAIAAVQIRRAVRQAAENLAACSQALRAAYGLAYGHFGEPDRWKPKGRGWNPMGT